MTNQRPADCSVVIVADIGDETNVNKPRYVSSNHTVSASVVSASPSPAAASSTVAPSAANPTDGTAIDFVAVKST